MFRSLLCPSTELTPLMLIIALVVSFLVYCRLEVRCGLTSVRAAGYSKTSSSLDFWGKFTFGNWWTISRNNVLNIWRTQSERKLRESMILGAYANTHLNQIKIIQFQSSYVAVAANKSYLGDRPKTIISSLLVLIPVIFG